MSKTKRNNKSTTKRHLRADGLSLLPSALRPRLVGGSSVKSTSFRLVIISALSLVFSFFLQNTYVPNTSAVSLTLTIPYDALSVNINPSTDNGFAKSADSTISVSTEANWGYELSIKAKDDNTLKNGTNSISSITTSIDENTFKSGTTYNNKWGFKPSKVNGSSNDKFLASPTSSAPTVLEKTSSSSSSPTQYIIAIGAKADNTLTTGTYSNNFTFTAVANTVSYTITYNLNEGEWTGTSPQTGSTTDKTVNISDKTPTRSNYEFQGWCTVQPTDNSGSNPTCLGTTINPSGSYTLSSGSNDVDLYAIWKSTLPPAVNKGSLGTMQNFNCNSSLPNIHEYGTVTDSRDNNTYKVAKLMDGKCWMIENLRIVGRSISSSNSDMASGSYSIPTSNLSTFNGNGSRSSDPNNNAAYVDSTYGGYYTFNTATAGTGSSVTSNGANVTGSICPKGWKLPTSGSSSSGDFADLVTAYGGNNSTGATNLRNTPVPGFTLVGYIFYRDGLLDEQGSSGNYWSSTSLHSTRAYALELYSSSADPAKYGNRVNGYSVRCLAR